METFVDIGGRADLLSEPKNSIKKGRRRESGNASETGNYGS